MKYIITGCGASGTGWASKVMTLLGSNCGHETAYGLHGRIYTNGIEGDSSWLAMPYIALADCKVDCLVRHPLKVTRSLVSLNFLADETEPFSAYTVCHLPEIRDAPDRLGRIIRYVALWDRAAPHYTAIEDLNAEGLQRLYIRLTGRGVRKDTCRRVLRTVESNVNTHVRDEVKLSWDVVRRHPDGYLLERKAIQHGYSTS